MIEFCQVSNISTQFMAWTSLLIQRINGSTEMGMREGKIYIVTGKGRYKRKIQDIVVSK